MKLDNIIFGQLPVWMSFVAFTVGLPVLLLVSTHHVRALRHLSNQMSHFRITAAAAHLCCHPWAQISTIAYPIQQFCTCIIKFKSNNNEYYF